MTEASKKPQDIIAILSRALSQNMNNLSGESKIVNVESLSFDSFESEADKIKVGRFLFAYTESDHAALTMLLPEAAQKIFFSKFTDFKSSAKNEASVTKLLNRISGNLPFVCAVKEDGRELNIFTIQKPYTDKLKDQLLWDTSECNIFRCSAFGAVFYLSLNIEVQKLIEALLKTDNAFTKVLRERVFSTEISEEGLTSLQDSENVKLAVKNPLEFIIGSCFLPREAYIGKKTLSVVFKEIAPAKDPGKYVKEGLIWYRFWIKSKGIEYSVYYSIDVKGQQEKYYQFFKRLFAEMVKQTTGFLRGQLGFEGAWGKLISRPSAADLEDITILNAAINWESKRINTTIIVPGVFISGYLASVLTPWEVELLEKSTFNMVLSLLSINSTMFGRNIDTFYRQTGSDGNKAKQPPIGVSKILAILDTLNAGKLVQNYFLASGGSLTDFKSLFVYSYNVEGEDVTKLSQDPLFNKEEYKKFIPKALHSDWDSCSGRAADYEEMAALNEKALRGIYEAIQEDKLLMPYKVSFILYNELQKPIDARFKAEIDRLLEENRWQDLIAEIPKKTGQQVISATPTTLLGTALVPGKPAVSELAPFMSNKKRQELTEEVRIHQKKYEKGGISAEKVFLAMEELLEILDKLAVPDDEMI